MTENQKEHFSKTNRKYVGQIIRSKVPMAKAVIELSANAFKVLNLVYYGHICKEKLRDQDASKIASMSRRPYMKAKDELIEKGYIRIHQIGSTKYKWIIGSTAIEKDRERYDKPRTEKANKEFAEKVLKYYNPQDFYQEHEDKYLNKGKTGVYEVDI